MQFGLPVAACVCVCASVSARNFFRRFLGFWAFFSAKQYFQESFFIASVSLSIHVQSDKCVCVQANIDVHLKSFRFLYFILLYFKLNCIFKLFNNNNIRECVFVWGRICGVTCGYSLIYLSSKDYELVSVKDTESLIIRKKSSQIDEWVAVVVFFPVLLISATWWVCSRTT